VEKIAPMRPDDSLRAELERAVCLLGLAYCSVDMEYDSRTGSWYFLDFSPGGLFLGWSRALDINLARLLAEYALGVLRHGGRPWQCAW
jgi:hypothetical protein